VPYWYFPKAQYEVERKSRVVVVAVVLVVAVPDVVATEGALVRSCNQDPL